MRFVYGPIPEDPEFDPAAEGWKSIREPDPVWMQVWAVPIMIAAGWLTYRVIALGTPMAWREVMSGVPLAFLLMIPVHEFIHALANPRFGFTRRTLIGIWPSRLLFYAHYEGELTRARFLTILAAPTIALTVVPLLACVAFGLNAPAFGALAFANALGAAGDMLGILVIFTQIPRGALVRNKGWRSYWKRPAEAAILARVQSPLL